MYQLNETRLSAFAKVNLSLAITARRADGFHELEMLNCTIALRDTVTIRLEEGQGVEFSHAPESSIIMDPGENTTQADSSHPNLCVRAALAYQQAFGQRGRIVLSLEKHTPIGAGLGGGSSDAAAVLRHLAVVSDKRPSYHAVREVALRLGADVPYFLTGGACIVRGVGENVARASFSAPLPELLLWIPPWTLATPLVYQRFRELVPVVNRTNALPSCDKPIPLLEWWVHGQHLHNDLTLAVDALSPRTKELRQAVYEKGGHILQVTGSGSALFCLLDRSRASSSLATLTPIAEAFGVRLNLTSLVPESFCDALD